MATNLKNTDPETRANFQTLNRPSVGILMLGGTKRVAMARLFKVAAEKRGIRARLYAYELSKEAPIAAEAEVIEGLRWNDPEIYPNFELLAQRCHIDIVVPFVDPAVEVAAKFCRLPFAKEHGIFSPTSSPEDAALMFDKVKADQRFRSLNFPLPTVTLGSFPLIAKPRLGSASKGIKILTSQAELATLSHREDYLLQRYIENREEYTVDCYVDTTGNILALSPRKRLEVQGGEATVTETFHSKEVENLSSQVLTSLGLRGAITLQFLRDLTDNSLMLMEVNPRLGGGAVASVYAGADIPGLIIDDWQGEKAEFEKAQPQVKLTRYMDEVVFTHHGHRLLPPSQLLPKKVLIIAEAGVNHNGSYQRAAEMVRAAKEAGADYVKFQTAVPELVISSVAPKAEYQKETTGADESQLEMCRKIHLPLDDYKPLAQLCREVGIGFMSTPFDLKSIDCLAEIGQDYWKIPSGEITNLPYLRKIAQKGGKVIMSTGMAELPEIEKALEVLEAGGLCRQSDIFLLHCNTQYPTPMADVNLRAMASLRSLHVAGVGYSDHTVGIEVPIAAVALGADIIEKHFTLDKTLPGPDHRASLDPAELKAMVAAIRSVEQALGSQHKHVSPSERPNIEVARKSIVAARDIKKGELLTEDNLAVKRPGNGLSPMMWEKVVGTHAVKDFPYDHLITLK